MKCHIMHDGHSFILPLFLGKHLSDLPSPEVIKLFSCSTQLSTKIQLLINLKYRQIKKFLALSLSVVVFILLLNVIMPTIIFILTFMSRINFMLSRVEYEQDKFDEFISPDEGLFERNM